MRDFGSLPRPTSRFQRPRRSWLLRVFQAVRLRFGFVVVWVIVAGIAFYQLYSQARSYGYLYSVKERGQLWARFPDRASMATLEQIYGSEAEIPEIRLARQIDAPFISNPKFPGLLKDPLWAKPARVALGFNLESRLRNLEQGGFYYRFEEFLAGSENGRFLTPDQRQRLDLHRRDQTDWFLDSQPDSEARVQAYRYRMLGWYGRPAPLAADLRSPLLAKARQNQGVLLKSLSQAQTAEAALPILRRLQLQVALAGLAPGIGGQLEGLARRAVTNCAAGPTDENVIVVAHYKKLLPRLDLGGLKGRLAPAQQNLLDCLRDLTANP